MIHDVVSRELIAANRFTELELHRLLRTEAYNTAQRQSGSRLIQDMLKDDIRILHGLQTTLKTRKLLRNSPLPHELMYADCDYHLLSLGDIHCL